MDAMYKHFLTFLLLFGSGVGALLPLEPLNVAVLRGSNVSFTATVTPGWSVMTWNVDKLLVLTIIRERGAIQTFPRFVGRNVSTVNTGEAWEFSIIDVQKNDTGPVVCSLQGVIGFRTATLEVQERGTVKIMSGNQTVSQDEQAVFRCEMSGWFPAPEVRWLLGGEQVNTSLQNTTFQAQGAFFNGISILRMRAVRDTTVQCRAFLSAATVFETVFLTVVPTPTDWTVLIAVVVVFSSVALLVLLIIGIIFCCRRKKEKENELRQGRMQGGAVAARPRKGTINLGFAMDDRTSVTPSVDSGISHSPSIYQIPPVDNPTQSSENDYPVAPENVLEYRKHRHLTHV